MPFLKRFLPGVLICCALPYVGLAATRYVMPGSTYNGPGTNWDTAFHDIQSGIDAATNANDLVLVNDGVYATGTRVTPGGAVLNRIVATNAITIHSLSLNPAATVIKGAGPQGNSAVRCAYLSGGAKLIGFTLSNGFTRATGDYYLDMSGGGAYVRDATISNCVVVANSAYYSGAGIYGSGAGVYGGQIFDSIVRANAAASGYGGGICGAVVDTSTIISNYAHYGGGAYNSILNYCPVVSNEAYYTGGGIQGGVAIGCMVTDNSVTYSGGGIFEGVISESIIARNGAPGGSGGGCYSSLVFNCTISGNTALYGGGGTYDGVVSNCVICSNSVTYSGGGTSTGLVINSLIFANTAGGYGGGAVSSMLSNCTVVANSATSGGGGTYVADARNSIIYYNTSPGGFPNYQAGALIYCCTTPDPGGAGNITTVPGFVDRALKDYHLSPSSMCISAGNNLYAPVGLELEGNARICGSVIDIGAYESPYALVNVAAMTHGSISPSGRAAVVEFTSPIFTITADPGYYVSNVTVDAVPRGGVTSYEFHNITTNHTLSAQSLLLPTGPTNVINASAGFGGTITPSGAVLVPRGSNQVFVIKANPAFATICDVRTNGASVGATNYFTFYNINTNHTIDAFFFTYVDTNGYPVTKLRIGDSNKFIMAWFATNNWAYTLQQTALLVPAVWTAVPGYVDMIGNGEMYLTNSVGTNASMFYRFTARQY